MRLPIAVLAATVILAGTAGAFKASDVAMLRATRSCFKCDFRGVNLAGENHFKANLRETDMTGANLDKLGDSTGPLKLYSLNANKSASGCSLNARSNAESC